jgi:UDP-N-acetyl-D-mannosaminuronic acid dehydrogenase
VIVATNHSEYSTPEALRTIAELAGRDCLVVDPWNALGTSQVFAYVAEVAALQA